MDSVLSVGRELLTATPLVWRWTIHDRLVEYGHILRKCLVVLRKFVGPFTSGAMNCAQIAAIALCVSPVYSKASERCRVQASTC